MMRVTPLRFTTLQCSQIGFTLVRTFTGAPVARRRATKKIREDGVASRSARRLRPDPNSNWDSNFNQGDRSADATVAIPAREASGNHAYRPTSQAWHPTPFSSESAHASAESGSAAHSHHPLRAHCRRGALRSRHSVPAQPPELETCRP